MVAIKDWRSGISAKDEHQLLHRRILFKPAQQTATAWSKMQLLQLEPLNELPPLDFAVRANGEAVSKQDLAKHGLADSAKKIYHLSDNSNLDESWLTWDGPMRIGAGLQNLGNTCFLNSVLQCMTYTPPLARYLRSGKHKLYCQVTGFCAVCALEAHVKQALSSTGKVISPQFLVKNLRCISRAFQPWRQEDAHEYMRYLVEALHKCLSNSSKNMCADVNQSFVHTVFGGRLRSQVKCSNCLFCSDTFDPFLDLSLEIVNADSLPRALAHFTRKEIIDGENKYFCEKCKQKVRATKCFTIENAPNILTIQFKRFLKTGHFGGKINKKVDFGQTLDLTPYLSKGQEVCKYKLYAVLVHSGGSMNSGHYYCFVRTSTDIWHVLDDSQVKQVSERTVLEQRAYILFYVRESIPKKNMASLSPSVQGAVPRKAVLPSNSLQVMSSPNAQANANLDSLFGRENVVARQLTDLEKHVKTQYVQPKDMRQLVTELKISRESSPVEPKAKPDKALKNDSVRENGSNSADNLPERGVISQITEQDSWISPRNGKAVIGQITEEDSCISTRNGTAVGELGSLSPSGVRTASLQQQVKLIPAKSVDKEHKTVGVSMTEQKFTRSCKEHVEGSGKAVRKGTMKKKSIKSSRLYHLTLLQVMPRARIFLSNTLFLTKKRSKGRSNRVLHHKHTPAGITVNSSPNAEKAFKKRKSTCAQVVSSPQKRLQVENQAALEQHYVRKESEDSAKELDMPRSLAQSFVRTEAAGDPISKLCADNCQVTQNGSFEEPNVLAKLSKKTEADRRSLSVAGNGWSNGNIPMIESRHLYEKTPHEDYNSKPLEISSVFARHNSSGESGFRTLNMHPPANELYGADVQRWSEANESKQLYSEIDNFLKREHPVMHKAIDTWDEAYDRGKVKKSRKRGGAVDNGFRQHENKNPFQNVLVHAE